MGPYGTDTYYAPRSEAKSDSDRPLPSLPFRLRARPHNSGVGAELFDIDCMHRGYGLCEKLMLEGLISVQPVFS